MLWTDKAFEIWMGNAGKGKPRAHNEAGIEAIAYERTLAASEDGTAAATESKAGWLTRTKAALADRAQRTRTARG